MAGNDKHLICSVLLPSRARPAHLIGAIGSLLGRAKDPSSIEILVRIDQDDIDRNFDFFAQLKAPWSHHNIRVFHGPRGRGYEDLHLMYNQLAAEAKGDWMFQFNDDMRLEPNDKDIVPWDEWIRYLPLPAWALCVQPCNMAGEPTNVSPLVRTDLIRKMGHFSLNAHCDTWIERVCAGHIFQTTCIKVRHLIDQMRDEVTDSRDKSKAWPEFETPAVQELIMRDHAIAKELGLAISNEHLKSVT